ncbi:MAG: hypothetical protein RI575_17000 [Balneolaceae bacterium]|nr:hypothetical protein [Balneolaceae bacterium]MDR9410460.1 hypothetical protein [Balneolaceae bacterium]
MISHTTNRFWKAYEKLTKEEKQQANKAFRLFQEDPSHPSLKFKKIHSAKPIYSARVNISCRALGIRDGEEIIWFWIGSHDEYERIIEQL